MQNSSPNLKELPEALSLARKTLATHRPDQFELFYMRSSATKMDSRDQKIDSLTRADDVGLAIRVKKNQKTGFSYTTSQDPRDIEKAVSSALEVASVMPTDSLTDLGGFVPSEQMWTPQFDQAGLDAPIQKKIELAKKLERLCREADPRIQSVRAAAISESQFEIHLLDHQETHLQYSKTLYVSNVTCKAEQDGDAQVGADSNFHYRLDDLDVERTAQSAVLYATELLGAKTVKTMKCPAVIRNSVVTDLLDFLSSSFSGEEISKGRSMLSGKEGQMIFSPKINFLDDALLAGGYSTKPFDGEGTASQSTPLVQDGIFKNMLLDRYYAKKLGKVSTGKTTRSLKAPPTISVTNLIMSPGQTSFEGLLKEANHGVMITDLLGVHTANPVTGAFSLGASGILIENGRLTRPIKGFAVAGNVIDLFKNVATLGSDFRMFGNVGAGSILIPELSVSGD